MAITLFEEIDAWKISKQLAVDVYKLFGESRDFGFKDQICRASVSISNNIAEGFARWGNIEFRRFLIISKWSCAEVQSMLHIGKELQYINEEQFLILYKQTVSIMKLLNAFIKSISL
jgi:four helix bundle protein